MGAQGDDDDDDDDWGGWKDHVKGTEAKSSQADTKASHAERTHSYFKKWSSSSPEGEQRKDVSGEKKDDDDDDDAWGNWAPPQKESEEELLKLSVKDLKVRL